MNRKSWLIRWCAVISLGLIVIVWCAFIGTGWRGASASPPTPPANPDDPLAIPVLPENPTQYDLGKSVYYYNCMPCHGDKGQGLSYEWRMVWDEDHQNCWSRGCHGGRERDEGFPLPHFIPGFGDLPAFATAGDLFDYLRSTHPPQRPGKLSEEDYWSVTAYLMIQANRMSPTQNIGPSTAQPRKINGWLVVGIFVLIVSGISLSLILQRQ